MVVGKLLPVRMCTVKFILLMDLLNFSLNDHLKAIYQFSDGRKFAFRSAGGSIQ
jgi:hypothetical protein